jgi:PPOX class probable F420-dependent enzyme
MLPRLLFAPIAILAALSAIGVAYADVTPRDADALAKATYLYIATVRKDGNQSTAAPVWFIAGDKQVFIDTNSDSWKAKRVRRGSPMLVWIGTRTGPAFIAKAEIVQDAAQQDMMIREIPNKYFLARMGFFGPSRAKFDSGKVVTIRISPLRDLPDGFQSQPGTPAPTFEPAKSAATN